MEISPATFAALLTASGAPIAAGAIQAAITFLKSLGLTVLNGREKLTAFALSILTVLLAVWVGLTEQPPRYAADNPMNITLLVVSIVLAIYNITRLSMAIYDDVTNKDGDRSTITNPAGWNGS